MNIFRTLRDASPNRLRLWRASFCRVWSISRLAPSSFISARVRLSAPLVRVLIILFVKSRRVFTIARLPDMLVDWVLRDVVMVSI